MEALCRGLLLSNIENWVGMLKQEHKTTLLKAFFLMNLVFSSGLIIPQPSTEDGPMASHVL